MLDPMSLSAGPSFGTLLRQWRSTRKLSQLALADIAEISTRHISFMETGRAQPSREMVLVLGSVLEVPLRERNAMLAAAGFAPAYRETDLSAPEMAPVRKVLDFLLRQAEPYGAVVLDGAWDILMTNRPAQLLTTQFVEDPAALLQDGRLNMLRLLFHPAGARKAIVNWADVARDAIARAQRELHFEAHGPRLAALVEEALSYPDVPQDFRVLDLSQSPSLLIPVQFAKNGLQMNVFSTITTLGTAQDVTLQEIRIESYFPADEQTDALAKQLFAQLEH